MRMTDIYNKTERRTRGCYAVLTRRSRRIVAAFLPGDLLELREAGCRTRFALPLDAVFRLAIRTAVEAARRARRDARLQR